MKSIFNKLLSQYHNGNVQYQKKAEYTVVFLGLLYIWAIFVFIYKSFLMGLSFATYGPALIFLIFFTIIILFLKSGKLKLALNIFITTGFIRLIYLLKDVDNIEFYIMILINILVTAFVYIENYQLIGTYIFYIGLMIVKIMQYYKLAGIGQMDFMMVHFGMFALFGIIVYMIMISQMIKIITSDIEKTVKLEYLANRDFLTGTYNRRMFDDSVNKLSNSDYPVSLILFDIDFFKNINDTYGHKTGDAILVEIAKITEKEIRKSDSLYRWGGEEFIIILRQTNLYEAKLVADKLRKIFENYQFENISESITISYGVSELEHNQDFEQLVSKADQALYKAKSNGRNRVEIY